MFSLIKKLLDIKWKEYKLKIGTYEIDKISLSCFDDKRFVLDDGVNTLAYFHKDSVTSCKKDCVDNNNNNNNNKDKNDNDNDNNNDNKTTVAV